MNRRCCPGICNTPPARRAQRPQPPASSQQRRGVRPGTTGARRSTSAERGSDRCQDSCADFLATPCRRCAFGGHPRAVYQNQIDRTIRAFALVPVARGPPRRIGHVRLRALQQLYQTPLTNFVAPRQRLAAALRAQGDGRAPPERRGPRDPHRRALVGADGAPRAAPAPIRPHRSLQAARQRAGEGVKTWVRRRSRRLHFHQSGGRPDRSTRVVSILLASRAARCGRAPAKVLRDPPHVISLALTHGVNHKYLAERCGTSLAMIERHYGRFMPGNEDAQLALLTEAAAPTEQPENRVKPRPRRGKGELTY